MPNLTPPAFARAVVFGACGFLGRVVTRQLLAAGTRVLGIDTRPWPEALPGGYEHRADGSAALADAALWLAGCAGTCSAGQGAPPPGPRSGQGAALPLSKNDTTLPPNGIPKGQVPLAGMQGAELPAGARGSAPASGCAPVAFFHLAGLADAGVCQKDPALAQRLNVDLVAEALAALADVPCVFIFPSTGIVYGDRLGRPAREDDPLVPGAEYARGKIKAEALVREACRGGTLRGAIARLSNLYGPGGGENTVLGRILAQARRGEALRVWDESPVRDFLYVADAAEGLIRLGLTAHAPERPERTLVANLSTGLGTRIGALLDLGAELFHTSRLPQERDADPGALVSSLVLDNARLAALTGWRPVVRLAQGLRDCF